jgi:hypothetical protein
MVQVHRRFGGTYSLHLQDRTQQQVGGKQRSARRLLIAGFLLGLLLPIRPTETSVNFFRTTRSYMPDDRTLHSHRCENLKSKILYTSHFLKQLKKRYIGVIAQHYVTYDNPTCERRLQEDELATHISCDCEAIAYLRFRHLGHFFMEPSEYYDAPRNKSPTFHSECRINKGLSYRGSTIDH